MFKERVGYMVSNELIEINNNHFVDISKLDPFVCWRCGSFDLKLISNNKISDDDLIPDSYTLDPTCNRLYCECSYCRSLERGNSSRLGRYFCGRLSHDYFTDNDVRSLAKRRFKEIIDGGDTSIFVTFGKGSFLI